MWACVTLPSRPVYLSRYENPLSDHETSARNTPTPVVETVGTSSYPVNVSRECLAPPPAMAAVPATAGLR